MFACRAAWQRCGPLARQSLNRAHLSRDVVPRRLMSSVPGGSGENVLYAVLCGGAFAGALAYAYRTVTSDRDRFIDRMSEIEARPKSEWKPKSWPPKSGNDEASEVMEAEAIETAESVAEDPVTAVENETGVLMETAEVNKKHAGSLETVVEKVAETVAETAEVVVEVAEVVAETAEVVAETAEVVVKVAEVVAETAEVVAETAEVVVEVAEVVAETAEEVATVAEEVEKVAQEVEAAAEAIAAPVIQVEEPASESNGTPPAFQEEAITEADETKA